MTKDQRKVQFTGNSTYIVSLPIKWIHDTGIEVGDALTLTPMPNKTLHISYSAVSTERSDLKAMIEYSHSDSAENNFRILISNYLAGYNIIKLTSVKGFNAHDRKFIKDSVRQKLIGLELIEESRTELVFQCLLNYSDLFLRRVIKNMYGLVRSMLEDSMKALRDYNVGIAEDVIQRDDDVDRFYFLSVRQLNAAIEDIELSDTIGIRHPQECLEYRLITKIIERIGDHAVKIAVNTQRIDSAVNPDNSIFKMAELAINVFKSSIDSIAQEDLQTINQTVEEAKNISQFGVSLESRKLGNTGNVEMSMILESLRRIAEYSGDIAEASMNMNVKT
ncbi:PhoU domain-containing protein [Methanosarcina sp.]|uniref:PhoU domain-containing protein n=1 Tax=Methanosarcina sp. TaxID=2213 RepID=UPI00298903F0|nr:PhoU domain-containing protein [Methanosarcina sp.]MDW5549039.1 PhoU domain-containing protein [Methanosarcina sp.]MDW5552742.1 PhoU domain-containing protein [Methanosarcina sp.]